MNAPTTLKETGRPVLSGTTATFHGPDGWTLVADRLEVFQDDPGQGTPLMVFGPDATSSGTLGRVLGTAETDTTSGRLLPVPGRVMAWLEYIEEKATAWVFQ